MTRTYNPKVSSVPLGSQYAPQSPVRKHAPNDKTHISTRDAIGEKVVGRPKTFAVAPKKKVTPSSATQNHASPITGVGGAKAPTNRTMQTAIRAGVTTSAHADPNAAPAPTTAVGVRRGVIPTNQIGSNAVLAGAPPTTTNAAAGKPSASAATAASSGASPSGRPITPQRHFSNPLFRDPADPRFAGAAGAPSTIASRPHMRVVGKAGATVEGAAGQKSTERAAYEQRFHKKVQHTVAGQSYENVVGGSSPTSTPSAPPPAEKGGKRLIPGRSTISPFRGVSPSRSATAGATDASAGGLSPYRLHSVSKPFATDDDRPSTTRPATSPSTANKTSMSGAANSGAITTNNTVSGRRRPEPSGVTANRAAASSNTLVGVFKPDPTLIRKPGQRSVSPQAPWEVQQSAPSGGRSRVLGATSNARKDHVAAVLSDPPSGGATGASVGSSNIMGRISPFRGGVSLGTNNATMPAAGKASASGEDVRRQGKGSSLGASTSGAPARDTRPVWKQTPRVEKPRSTIGGCRRQATAAPAPWATD